MAFMLYLKKINSKISKTYFLKQLIDFQAWNLYSQSSCLLDGEEAAIVSFVCQAEQIWDVGCFNRSSSCKLGGSGLIQLV